MRYVLACLHCDARIAATEHVGAAEVVAAEKHLRAEHSDKLPTGGWLDFAEVLGHVRVRMVDIATRRAPARR